MRSVKILLAAVCALFTVYIVVCAISYANRPISPDVTVEEIKKAVETVAQNRTILVSCNDRAYRIPPSYNLGKLFEFDEWEQLQERTYGTPVLSFCLADEWIVDLHSDGKACAYDGYSPSEYKSNAYYVVPKGIINALSNFIEENGELQDLYHAHEFYH